MLWAIRNIGSASRLVGLGSGLCVMTLLLVGVRVISIRPFKETEVGLQAQ